MKTVWYLLTFGCRGKELRFLPANSSARITRVPPQIASEESIRMPKRSLGALITVLFFAISVYAQSAQNTTQATEKTKYELLLEKVKLNDQTVDFTELRTAFFESPDFHPLTPMMTYRPLYNAVTQKNYVEALKIAQSVLAKNFVEVNAHMVAHLAYQETGNAERAQFHKFMADGLLNSIKASGDGRSMDTAFVVISINEEYGLLRSLGRRPIKQELVPNKDHRYDALTVIDLQTNQERVIYFNVDKPFHWEGGKKQ